MSESLAESFGLVQVDLNEFIHKFVKLIIKENLLLKNKIGQLEQESKKQNKMIDEMIEILNQWMPLAECAYWNYAKHTCSHTCRGCNSLSKYNRRTDSGILIDDDRYCRLYENGNAEEDTVFVKIEDLMLRHNIKSFFEKKVEGK